ncbi:FUSC family protein [Rhodococcus rhodochrous]|uniref:FUSC family protein n=1 Tax=Rhodococcus rhodochrous TaxID=1829 RepID=UPI001E317476|nr:FUSC family protein [Rhodococcus rhodochrous]MCB8910744.1 FUSC family protein [Rhodococcus rhodochrous]
MLDRRLDDRPQLRHARGALAHPLSASAWKDALEVRRGDPTVAVALRVGLATMLALVGGGLLGYGQVAGFAALGALTSAFLRYEPYPRLAVRLPWVGLGIVGYTAFGAALGAMGAPLWVQIVVLSLGSAVAYWVFTAFSLMGPGPVILIFAAAGAAGFSDGWTDAGLVTAAAAIGALLGYVVAMLPALSHPHTPARLAVARALAAVSAVEIRGAEAVPIARQSIRKARETVALNAPRRPDTHVHELAALLDAAETVLDSGSHDTARARRDDFARFEKELRKARRDIEIPRVDAEGRPVLPTPPGFVREGCGRLLDRLVLIGAARIFVASLLAASLAALIGLDHPLWAAMGAMAALQGLNYRNTVQRGIQRLVGNVGGAMIAAVLLAIDLGYWPVVAAAVLFQTVTELTVTRNYGLASVGVTTMALLLTGLGQHAGPGLAVNRVADTLIGVVVGVIVAAVTIRRDDRHHLVA